MSDRRPMIDRPALRHRDPRHDGPAATDDEIRALRIACRELSRLVGHFDAIEARPDLLEMYRETYDQLWGYVATDAELAEWQEIEAREQETA